MPDWKDSLKFAGGTLADAGRAVGRMARESAAAAARPTHVCTHCGYVGKPHVESKINGCFAVALLLCFIIPGILYIIWASGGVKVCPKCRTRNSMIPIDSPQARALAVHATAPPVRQERPCPFCAETILEEARVCKHCGRDVAR